MNFLHASHMSSESCKRWKNLAGASLEQALTQDDGKGTFAQSGIFLLLYLQYTLVQYI